jgi:ribosome maturation protein Sdo1
MDVIAEQLRAGQIDVSEALRRVADKARGGHATDVIRLASERTEFYEGEIARMGEKIEELEKSRSYGDWSAIIEIIEGTLSDAGKVEAIKEYLSFTV